METMECIEALINKNSINTLDVGSEHWVDVTHINNPHSFYVRPTVYRANLSILHRYKEPLLPNELILGSIVIYKSKLLECYVRGRIMFIQDDPQSGMTCDLSAPDYGCFEKSVPLKTLHKPYHCISADVPPLAIHCKLAGCSPHAEGWSDKVIESMKFFIGNERAKIIIRRTLQDTFIVDLINSCPDDIATMLAYNGSTTFGYGDNMVSRFGAAKPKEQFYSFKRYDVGETVTVRVQTGDSLRSFYVAEVDDYKHLLNEKENITYYCKRQKMVQVEDIEIGKAVGVLIITANKYERGIVTAVTVHNEKAKVMLVDSGKIMEVPVSQLKPMNKFFELRATAIHCSAEESQAWDNGLHKFLYPGFKFKITIVQLGEQLATPHIVSISPE